MNDFERLIAFLKIAQDNMAILHRHLTSREGWFSGHEKLGEWYEKIGAQLDDLAELGLMSGRVEPTLKDAVELYSDKIINAYNRNYDETMNAAADIMRDIAKMMISISEGPPDIIKRLQNDGYKWNKIANYMIARATNSIKAADYEGDDE